MTDYTPTTEEVRELVQGASAEEFDRWLADVKADTWQEGYTAGKPYPMMVSKNPYWQGKE